MASGLRPLTARTEGSEDARAHASHVTGRLFTP